MHAMENISMSQINIAQIAVTTNNDDDNNTAKMS